MHLCLGYDTTFVLKLNLSAYKIKSLKTLLLEISSFFHLLFHLFYANKFITMHFSIYC